MKKVLIGLSAILLCGALALRTPAAEKPLSQDDVLLLLLAGASTDKMLTLIEQRGIDFRMNPDLAKKFHDAGADDLVIEALQKAGANLQAASGPVADASKPASTQPPSAGSPASAPVASAAPASGTGPAVPSTGTAASAPRPVAKSTPRNVPLPEPTPVEIQRIIQEFAAKEKVFRAARNNYTYHQLNKLSELDPDGNVVGVYQQEWDILFDDSGKRIERVTYAPPDTLKRIGVTKEDLENMRNIQPFVLTTDELPDYDVKYLGHVRVDEITAYVFSVRPKEIKKDRLYFQGTVWVDDRDLQIVKSEGKTVPEVPTKKGENLFPRFTTYREQIDGKFWFPTYTIANDTLYFSTGAVPVKQIIRYTDYKQFKSKARILSTEIADESALPSGAGNTSSPKK
jgi:hypothetical protein